MADCDIQYGIYTFVIVSLSEGKECVAYFTFHGLALYTNNKYLPAINISVKLVLGGVLSLLVPLRGPS